MDWHQYVEQVIGDDRQVDAARKTGVDQTTISRWLNPSTSRTRLTSQAVRAFAKGYNRPVLEAFVVAGFLTRSEAGMVGEPLVDLSRVDKQELLEELGRRLA